LKSFIKSNFLIFQLVIANHEIIEQTKLTAMKGFHIL